MKTGRSLLEKIWDVHVVASLGDGLDLLHVDRHLLHDLNATRGLTGLRERKLGVRNPSLNFAVADHGVSSMPGRGDASSPVSEKLLGGLRALSRDYGIPLYDMNDRDQGIVHVIGPELGLTLPGTVLVCGDSHTCTHGALGALAWGIGASELTHVLVTQTIIQRRPKLMQVSFEGTLQKGVLAKDLVLYLIGKIGSAGGTGHAIEYSGSAIRALSIESRMTICNLSIEFGAKIGLVAPDDTTLSYIAGRPLAPSGAMWDRACVHWRTLNSDDETRFDREIAIDVTDIRPQVTWGTSPQDVIAIDEPIPDPAAAPDAARRAAMSAALDYMGLVPGDRIEGTEIDWVFIGSCTNSRISDLREAAAVIKGGKVHPRVRGWVVPGSQGVKREAEAEGLDRVFAEAGFEWREPGCSMCVAANSERVPPGQRAVSTSNRNFVGRQGPGARTHLASPSTAAAAALAGKIVDVRKMGR